MYFFCHLGKSLAFTRIDFTNPAGELVAYGRKLCFADLGYFILRLHFTDHTKYIGKSSSDPVSPTR